MKPIINQVKWESNELPGIIEQCNWPHGIAFYAFSDISWVTQLGYTVAIFKVKPKQK